MKLFCNLFILSVVDRHLGCLQFLFLQTILFVNILHVQELTQGRGLQSFFFYHESHIINTFYILTQYTHV